MAKPKTIDGYNEQVTHDCERVPVTLLRSLGPWRDSIFLVGGLTPRYLVPDHPPVVPPHAGTLDLDIVLDVLILENTDAYKSLEENLRKIGFDNAKNKSGQKQNWRWQVTLADGSHIILELLADNPEVGGGKVQELPTDGNISALNVPLFVDGLRPSRLQSDQRRTAERRRDRDPNHTLREYRQLHLSEGFCAGRTH